MEQTILRLLGTPDYTPSNVPQLISLLELQPGQQQELQRHLKQMEQRGLIVRTKGNRYIVSREADLIPGVIQITRGGRGFVQPDEPGIGDVVVPGVVPTLSATPGRIDSLGPTLGDATVEVMRELLGISAADIHRLRQHKII